MTENNFQHQQFLTLCQENDELRLKISYEKQRKKEYKEKLKKLQILVNDASIKLNEGSDLIRKLQQHLKICQDKLSEKTKALVEKDNTINHLNDLIKQLMDEYTAQNLQYLLNINDNQKIDIGIQTSPILSIQRRSVRFNFDKENYSIDPKYFQSNK